MPLKLTPGSDVRRLGARRWPKGGEGEWTPQWRPGPVRAGKGRPYRGEVLAGKTDPSLTAIAARITGTHWTSASNRASLVGTRRRQAPAIGPHGGVRKMTGGGTRITGIQAMELASVRAARDRSHRTNPAVSARLRALEALDGKGLRQEWRRVYRVARRQSASAAPCSFSGSPGRSRSTRMAACAPAPHADSPPSLAVSTGPAARVRTPRLKPGARLVREWRGRTHTVTITEAGFEWNGTTWGALSTIAEEITGAHWSRDALRRRHRPIPRRRMAAWHPQVFR